MPKRRPALLDSIARLAAAHVVDVFVFAECALTEAEVTAALDAGTGGNYYAVPCGNRRLRFFSCVTRKGLARDKLWLNRLRNRPTDRFAILELRLNPSLLIGGIHFYDRRSLPTDAGRHEHAGRIATDIRLAEKDAGCYRTVLMGDFNMNPFEWGMVAARGFHALLSINLVRTVGGLQERAALSCFYNPTWGCFGDAPLSDAAALALPALRPPGSYFFENTLDPAHHFWNLYDQVLVRPELIDHLRWVQILASDGTAGFLTKEGRPSKGTLSDHLPVVIRLSLP